MTKRIFYLDLLRVWAIAAVVLLHCVVPTLTSASLYGTESWYAALVLNELARAGVPLFLMISGALLLADPRTADVGAFYKKRLPRITLPLLVWHTVYYIAHAATDGTWSVRAYFTELFANGSEYHMWFVYSLIGIYLLAPFLKRITDACTQKQTTVLLLIAAFPGTLRPLWNLCTGSSVYLFDPLLEPYLAYFLLGYLLSRVRLTGRGRWLAAACAVFGLALGIFGNLNSCGVGKLDFPFNGGYMLNHFLLAGALFVLARALTEERNVPTRLSAVTARLSDTSFGVYWIHVLLIACAQRWLVLSVSPIVLIAVWFVAVLAAAWTVMLALSLVRPLKKWIM